MILEHHIKLGSAHYGDDGSWVEAVRVERQKEGTALPVRFRLCFVVTHRIEGVIHVEEEHIRELPEVLKVLREEKKKSHERAVLRLSEGFSIHLIRQDDICLSDKDGMSPEIPFYVFEKVITLLKPSGLTRR